ncbi:hypothetical protein JW935_19965 [candidate division KSB1 bacterium]|nr:hypothetical protein [candidate division KSB1 bacterium]
MKKILLFLFLPITIFARDQGFHFRYDEWIQVPVRYLTLRQNGTCIRLSEHPYSRAEVYGILQNLVRNKKSRVNGTGFFFNRAGREVLFGFGRPDNKQDGFSVFNQMDIGYSPELHPTEPFRAFNDLVGYTRLRNNLSVYLNFQLDSDGLYDEDFHGSREWKNMVGDMRAAYFYYYSTKWSLLVGRDYLQWGPGRTGSLLISQQTPALDMLKFTADIGKIRFTAFNALPGRTPEQIENNQNRYFSGHRLSLLMPWAEFGLTETVMYGGPRQSVNAGFLNPLLPYYFTDVMLNSEKPKSNVTLAFDAALYPFKDWRFYGQFMVDEYYYEDEPYPNQTAWLVGFDWADVWGADRSTVNVEYVRLSRWVYNYEVTESWNRLDYYNTVFGHPLGPDSDMLRFEKLFYPGFSVLLRINFDYIRRGETSIHSPLVVAQQRFLTNPPFPFGTVETTRIMMFYCDYMPSINWKISAGIGLRSVSNRNHEGGSHESKTVVQVKLTWRGRYFARVK